jgi:mono/diheme cytochrome c family protein
MRITLGGLVLLLAALVGSASALDDGWSVPREAADRVNPLTPESPVAKKARILYNDSCAMCHGDRGDGRGPEADQLNTRPADFTSSAVMIPMTDGEVFYKISKGRNPMPSFEAKYTESERWGLVLYLRHFLKAPPKKK